jgi:hypothetical protein
MISYFFDDFDQKNITIYAQNCPLINSPVIYPVKYVRANVTYILSAEYLYPCGCANTSSLYCSTIGNTLLMTPMSPLINDDF